MGGLRGASEGPGGCASCGLTGLDGLPNVEQEPARGPPDREGGGAAELARHQTRDEGPSLQRGTHGVGRLSELARLPAPATGAAEEAPDCARRRDSMLASLRARVSEPQG